MWTIDDEVKFFNDASQLASIEQLMVNVHNTYYAFTPKTENVRVNTPQARNALIGATTEKWCKELFADIAKSNNLHAVNGVICNEIGLSAQSSADLAFCTTNDNIQTPDNIKLIFEIKMGIVNNYVYDKNDNEHHFGWSGDYTSHKGNPSLLRSDSMLKAIGKSINIRVDSSLGKKIPIIVLGNSPITSSYIKKVDCLKKSGVIQKFISLYPNPTDIDFIRTTPEKGFETFGEIKELESYISYVLNSSMNYFSSMISNEELGKLISLANLEKTDELKGKKFVEMLNM